MFILKFDFYLIHEFIMKENQSLLKYFIHELVLLSQLEVLEGIPMQRSISCLHIIRIHRSYTDKVGLTFVEHKSVIYTKTYEVVHLLRRQMLRREGDIRL